MDYNGYVSGLNRKRRGPTSGQLAAWLGAEIFNSLADNIRYGREAKMQREEHDSRMADAKLKREEAEKEMRANYGYDYTGTVPTDESGKAMTEAIKSIRGSLSLPTENFLVGKEPIIPEYKLKGAPQAAPPIVFEERQFHEPGIVDLQSQNLKGQIASREIQDQIRVLQDARDQARLDLDYAIKTSKSQSDAQLAIARIKEIDRRIEHMGAQEADARNRTGLYAADVGSRIESRKGGGAAGKVGAKDIPSIMLPNSTNPQKDYPLFEQRSLAKLGEMVLGPMPKLAGQYDPEGMEAQRQWQTQYVSLLQSLSPKLKASLVGYSQGKPNMPAELVVPYQDLPATLQKALASQAGNYSSWANQTLSTSRRLSGSAASSLDPEDIWPKLD